MKGAATVMAVSTPDPSYPPARHSVQPPDPGHGPRRSSPHPGSTPQQAPQGYSWPPTPGQPSDGPWRPALPYISPPDPRQAAGFAEPGQPGGYGTAPHPGGHRLPASPAAGYEAPATRAYAQVLPPQELSPWQLALPDFRNKVANALIELNWNQSMDLWKRRRRDPLNPHVLVFLFAEPPTGPPPRSELRIAARSFLAGDEQRLAMLLCEMVGVVGDHVQAGRDPNEYVYSWHEPMSVHARYVGVAVSSLDTPQATWAQVQRSANNEMDVPGRCYAHLYDDSKLLIDRLAKRDFGMCRVLSTDPIEDTSGEGERRWKYASDIAASDTYGPDNRATWQWLTKLHNIFLAR